MKLSTSFFDNLRNIYHSWNETREKKASFQNDVALYNQLDSNKRFETSKTSIYPYLNDKTPTTYFEGHYTYHPAWAARVVKKISPVLHIDISSTLHFCTIVSAFQEVAFYDYRPAALKLEGLLTGKADLTNLHFETNSIESLSCMHTIEHVGLGRYGDAIDPNADIIAMNELKRVILPGGNLIIVVPIGQSQLVFNAHRIYSFQQILGYFAPLKLKEFSLIPDNYIEEGMIINATQKDADKQQWGCGCFWFTK